MGSAFADETNVSLLPYYCIALSFLCMEDSIDCLILEAERQNGAAWVDNQKKLGSPKLDPEGIVTSRDNLNRYFYRLYGLRVPYGIWIVWLGGFLQP